ncbi:MAG: efflux RND transporter periplasmic adaptor subunit [Chitinophagaceae bacterium]
MKFLSFSFSILSLAVLLNACGGSDDTKGDANQLAKLKAEQKALQDKIKAIEAKAGPSKGPARKVPVFTTSMTPSFFATYVDVQGKVDVEEVVNAIPETPGIISAILVKPGQSVRKGQVVATLRSEQVDRGMAELDQQLEFAKTLYEKQQRLWAQEIGTEVQLLSAKNQYESLVKKKASVQSQRNTFNVVSPIDGVVDAVTASVGQSFASPMNPPVIRIINTSKLKVIANVAENYSGIVRTGSPAMLVFPDLRDSLMTKITYAERFINPTSRTFSAYVSLPHNHRYQPNMIAKVKIVSYQNNRAFVLPAALIQKTEQGEFVYVAGEDGKARLAPIQSGNAYEGKVEIVSGLTLGDKVITNGYEELNEGDVLQIENNQ